MIPSSSEWPHGTETDAVPWMPRILEDASPLEGEGVEPVDSASEYERAKPVDYARMAEVQKAFGERYLNEVR